VGFIQVWFFNFLVQAVVAALALGLGFFVDLLIKGWNASFFEKLLVRLGAGILLIPVLGVLFNHLRIPIYWPIFLVVAIIVFVAAFYFRKKAIFLGASGKRSFVSFS